MNPASHEQIRRFLAGDATPEEAAALEQALQADPAMRALYLDSVNLEVALESAAGRHFAEAEPLIARPAARPRWWLAAAAAVLVLLAFTVWSRSRKSSDSQADLASSIASTQAAIASLPVVNPAPTNWWQSPTDSLLPAAKPAPAANRIP